MYGENEVIVLVEVIEILVLMYNYFHVYSKQMIEIIPYANP